MNRLDASRKSRFGRNKTESMSTDLTFLTNEPGKALAQLRRNIPIEFLRSGYAHRDNGHDKPREVILSSVIRKEEAK